MRYFFRRRVPAVERVLLVESGPRAVLERAHERMRGMFPGAIFDVCTCYPGTPATGGFEQVFRVTEASGPGAKWRMLWAMRAARPPVAALMFTGDAVLLRWKLALAAVLPSKLLVVNENGDFFWLDWGNRQVLRQFAMSRMGVDGLGAVRGAFRVLVFPFILLYLVGYATVAYVGRWMRLLAGNHRWSSGQD